MPASSSSPPIDEFPLPRWNAILALNLTASFHTIRSALPAMKARKWGRIINIASAHALVASPVQVSLCCRQARDRGTHEDGRPRGGDARITMNAICPGYVWTPLVEKQIPDTAKARGSDRGTGDQRRAAPRAADEGVRPGFRSRGARGVSREQRCGIGHGAVIPIDGGWTAAIAWSFATRYDTRLLRWRRRKKRIPERPAATAPRPPGLPIFPGRSSWCLQGGGALGAYQVGVYEALHEAGIEPDWVIGTSIGAINAALIAGNAPANRVDGCATSGGASSRTSDTTRCAS
jgi:hypothetical protein